MSSVQPNWLALPDLARDAIMLKVGLEDLESLHRCRQVCTAWNEAILENIWGSEAKRNVIRARIERRRKSESEQIDGVKQENAVDDTTSSEG